MKLESSLYALSSVLKVPIKYCFFSILLLSGCSLFQSSPTNLLTPLPNDTVTTWNLKGKIGFRTVKDGGSAHFRWLQQNNNYELSLSGPLGQGAVTIQGNQHSVKLVSRRTNTVIAETPEQLIDQVFGWQVPISNLFFWIKGLPTPKKIIDNSTATYNIAGLLESFEQDGWLIQYSRFRNVDGWLLPHKTTLTRHDTKVTLIVAKWDLNPSHSKL